jgi:hypothetical protein
MNLFHGRWWLYLGFTFGVGWGICVNGSPLVIKRAPAAVSWHEMNEAK